MSDEVEIIKRPADSGDEAVEGETIGKEQSKGHDKKGDKSAGKAIKKSAWMAFAESLALVILGIMLIAWPVVVMRVISYTLGAFLAIKGCYKIMNYYMSNGHKNYFNNDLLWGIISVLAGITVIVLGEDILGAFRIVAGIWIIYEALVRLNATTKLSAAGVPAWRYTLLVAILMLVLGVFVTFNTGAVTQLIGAMMIVSGIIGIVGDVMFMQYVSTLVEKLTGEKL